ncbi:glycosyltransferase, partial [Turicibacter sanguinis]|nr:glycosyltransferase [Turicibacter sanguinis]
MENKKVLFVATVVKKHINVFHLPYLKWFQEQGFETHVAARDDFNGEVCYIPHCDKHFNIPFERSPLNKNNISSYRQLTKIINKNQYEIIHCHTPIAAMLTRFAAIKARKKGTRVIYTAHGFHFFKGAPIINWLIYFPVEFICSFFTDILITINQEDYRLAKKVMKAKQVQYIAGVGVDIKKFKNTNVDRDKKRKEIGVPEDAIMLLSVGELNKNKNHEVIIEALKNINNLN